MNNPTWSSSRNRLEIRDGATEGYWHSDGIPMGNWLLCKRESRNLLRVYITDGITETLKATMNMDSNWVGPSTFMYLKNTTWDDGTYCYPQTKGCFHELNDTWPPYVIENDDNDTLVASHEILADSEILVSENGGAFLPYSGPIAVGNANRPLGYWLFKTKAATGRLESITIPSSPFTAIPFEEGKSDLVFTQLQNISYNLVTKIYTSIAINTMGYGFNNNNYLPVNGSAAIYFNGLSRSVWIGFSQSETNSYFGDMAVSVSIAENKEILYSYQEDGVANYLAPSVDGNDYRLVCRMVSESRVWKIETTNDDWLTYDVLLTFPVQHNSVKLFPVLNVRDNASTESTLIGSEFEVYADQNIPEVDAITPDPPTVTGDDSTNSLSASHDLGDSEILVSENGGPFVAYTGSINVGNVARAAGYWRFKIKAATGRNESAVADSPAFTETTVPTYTLTVNVDGTTGYIISINGVIQVGNILSFEEGTVLTNIVVSKQGWEFNPSSVASLTMDSDKNISFTATELPTQNYMTGHDVIDPVPDYPDILEETSPGVWDKIGSELPSTFLVTETMPINGEIAVKVISDTDNSVYIEADSIGFYIDSDGLYAIEDDYIHYGDFATYFNAWLILRRTASDQLGLYVSYNGSTSELKHSWTITNSEDWSILGDIRIRLGYLQGKNLTT